MKAAVNGPQALAVDVGVMLRGADAGMAQEFLHRAQVGAAGEQVRRETMPQRVRAHPPAQPQPPHVFLDNHPQHLARNLLTATTDEDPRRLRWPDLTLAQ